jgi:hypothetical protein
LDNVALVESKEHQIDDTVYRRFKLQAMIAKDVQLTKQEIEEIRLRAVNTTCKF